MSRRRENCQLVPLVHGDPFGVTQEILAEKYTRGWVHVVDADRLLAQSCGYINIMHEEERRLRDAASRYSLGD